MKPNRNAQDLKLAYGGRVQVKMPSALTGLP
eukprot:CAMPEP_0206138062 /NCGR_PEP_ID=MMETSP1473-20131121/3044_1 /ASSEMBLY_ACC=CAM_ASM_001109 /TAXON_ID=1461547 /ORGANISM="Stichococcus sp, Strain RCC1054" /LENGTH=30 /DNA_ID= /DNA_START= /DNA_END= /DNA_ORIENTATION=